MTVRSRRPTRSRKQATGQPLWRATYALAGLCVVLAACGHPGGVGPEQETVTLTTAASDAVVLSGLSAAAVDFGGVGVPDPTTRAWHSTAMPFGSAYPGWQARGSLPAGTLVVTAQIADAAEGLRRVVFHVSLLVGVELKPEVLDDLTSFALITFVRDVRRHLAT